jgi:opacity protein-like surface antigen
MRKIALFVMSAAVLASSSAFAQAQGVTRAEVRQQLIEAQQDGSQLVSNASYPDVARIYTNQVTQAKQGTSAYGGVAAGSSASSSRFANAGSPSHEACVGPYSFCNIYAGS